MTISKEQLIVNYVSAIHEGDAALFIGAGMSRVSGHVDWKGLLSGCAKEIGLDLKKEHDLIAVAQYYLNHHGGLRWGLNRVLKNEFDRRGTFTKNHEIIGRLIIPTIWTTNFDSLIEQALTAAGRNVDIKSRDTDITMPKKGRDVVLYKMHGDIARPDEIVICKADYERYTLNHPIFHNALKSDLVSKTFLFLGFSFTDPNLNYMLGHLHSLLEGSQREHYAIMRHVRDARWKGEAGQELYEYDKNKQDLQIRELQRYNIRTHLVERFKDVTDILEAIEKRSSQRNIFVSGSANTFEEKFDENRMRNFCMLLGEMLVEKDYKLINGFGLNIGDSVIKGALLKLYDQGKGAIEEHLVLRPFPRNLLPEVQDTYHENYRRDMITKSGFAIFIAGNSRSEPISSVGVQEEYKIARELNKIPIPIGATGFAARQIWEMVKPEIEVLYSKAVSADLYGRLNNATLSDVEILNSVFEIIEKVAQV